MAIGDIPTRDGDDGTVQLAKLRAFIKDSTPTFKFLDETLIAFLVINAKEVVWRSFVGAPDTAVPWTFDTTLLDSYITKIRTLTGDIVETTVKYTDYELENFLRFLPLKYLVLALNVDISGTASTLPSDLLHPLRIMRDLLNDPAGDTYDDKTLINLMLVGMVDPYNVVVRIIESKEAVESAATAQTFGDTLASIDGISFPVNSTSSESSTETQDDLSVVRLLKLNSPYMRVDDTYNWSVNGKDVIETTVAGGWYAI